MENNQNNEQLHQNDEMLKEKTNQDFNNQKPDPKDPIQNKNHQESEEDTIEREKVEEVAKSSRSQKESQIHHTESHLKKDGSNKSRK